jgi:hypothetical protein
MPEIGRRRIIIVIEASPLGSPGTTISVHARLDEYRLSTNVALASVSVNLDLSGPTRR